jgi:predicted secreted protein
MKRSSALVIPFLLVVSLIAGCNGEVKTFLETDETITISVNQEFIISLDTNPPSGYQWRETYDESMLKLLRSTYDVTKKNNDEKEEVRLAQYFRFKALNQGETEITLAYKQPAAEMSAKQKIFSVNIE